MDIQEMVNDMRSDELSASQAVDLVEPRSSMTLENVDTLLDAH